jgi:murein DD-endopeptidase MepM/ murein hydrolase activator NlpD
LYNLTNFDLGKVSLHIRFRLLRSLLTAALFISVTACGAPARPESSQIELLPTSFPEMPEEATSVPQALVTSPVSMQEFVGEVDKLKQETQTPELDPGGASIQDAQTQVSTNDESFQMCSPLAAHVLHELPEIVSDPFNPPAPGKEERHHGVDFSYYRRGERMSIQGEEIQTVLAGRVAAALVDKFPYGNALIVETPASGLPQAMRASLGIEVQESLYILFAHMQPAESFELGQRVQACQYVGQVGKSGNAGVPHLHMETRIGPSGQTFASMLFYSTSATDEERENYLRWRTSGNFRAFDPLRLLGLAR